MPRLYGGKKVFMFEIDDIIYPLDRLRTQGYTSIWEDEFFAWCKSVHETYGVCILAPVFYHDWDGRTGSLDQIPDTYKAEFEACSNWLKFTFHAYTSREIYATDEMYAKYGYAWPDNSLRNAFIDYGLARQEIIRICGADSWYDEYYTIHTAVGRPDEMQAIADTYGNKMLGTSGPWTGIPAFTGEDKYYIVENAEFIQSMYAYEMWRDPANGLFFSARHCVLDYNIDGGGGGNQVDPITTFAEYLIAYPQRVERNYVSFISHDFKFISYFGTRAANKDLYLHWWEDAASWCLQNGYTSEFFSPEMLEADWNYVPITTPTLAYFNSTLTADTQIQTALETDQIVTYYSINGGALIPIEATLHSGTMLEGIWRAEMNVVINQGDAVSVYTRVTRNGVDYDSLPASYEVPWPTFQIAPLPAQPVNPLKNRVIMVRLYNEHGEQITGEPNWSIISGQGQLDSNPDGTATITPAILEDVVVRCSAPDNPDIYADIIIPVIPDPPQFTVAGRQIDFIANPQGLKPGDTPYLEYRSKRAGGWHDIPLQPAPSGWVASRDFSDIDGKVYFRTRIERGG